MDNVKITHKNSSVIYQNSLYYYSKTHYAEMNDGH